MLLNSEQQMLKKLLKTYNYNFQYLKPDEKVNLIVHSKNDLFYWKDKEKTKRGRRRIYYQVQFQQKQILSIKQVKAQLQAYKIFQNFPDPFILKHLHAEDMSVPKTLKRLQQLQKFHNSPVITKVNQHTIDSLENGLVYTYGFSKNYSPIIILRVDKFDAKKPLQQNFNFLYYLMLIVQNYKMIPYYSQKYIIIIDLNNMNISDLPYSFIYEALTKLALYYCGFTDKTFVYNAKGIGHIWTLIKNFLPQHSVKKVQFIDGNYDEVYKLIQSNQLQKRYGGSNQNLIEGQYWPPKATKKCHNYHQQYHKYQQTQFYTIKNQSHFFEHDLIHFQEKDGHSASSGCCHQCQIF